MFQTLLNTFIAPMFFTRYGYKGYGLERDRDSAGVPLLRVRTPLGDACGYAITPRAAVQLVASVLATEKATGYLPPSAVLYKPDASGTPRLEAMYFNPEKRS